MDATLQKAINDARKAGFDGVETAGGPRLFKTWKPYGRTEGFHDTAFYFDGDTGRIRERGVDGALIKTPDSMPRGVWPLVMVNHPTQEAKNAARERSNAIRRARNEVMRDAGRVQRAVGGF